MPLPNLYADSEGNLHPVLIPDGVPSAFLPGMGCDCDQCEKFLQANPGYSGPWMEEQQITTAPQYQWTTTDVAPIPSPPLTNNAKTAPKTAGTNTKSSSFLEWTGNLTQSKILYLIRGVRGSGKSSLGALISKGIRQMVPYNTPIYSVDDYFTRIDGSGQEEYNYDPTKLMEAHAHCQEQCRKHMAADGARMLIVANPFISRNHMLPYLRMAREFGYQVLEIICKGNFENIHGVPPDEVRKTKQSFEN